MKKIRVVVIWLFTVVILSGCWDRVEINDLAIVSAIGIDLTKDENILLSLQIAIPTKIGTSQGGGEAGGKSTYVISGTGGTISEAYRKIQMKVSRRIFFAQSRVLLIGEKLAKKGVQHILDFHLRYNEPRINSYIMFTKAEAAEIIKSYPELEKISAEETKELVKLGVGLSVLIRDFVNTMYLEGMEPVAPRFELTPLESNKKVQVINGVAVFKGDKLVGWMDDKETRGILWLQNKVKTAVITVDIPKGWGGGKISLDVLKAKTKLEPILEKGNLKMKITTDLVLTVMENDSKLHIDQTKILELVNKYVEEEVRNRIQKSLDMAQKDFQSDIFGFGEEVYKKYPKEWNNRYKKNWNEEFSQLEVSINPKAQIRRIGLTTK